MLDQCNTPPDVSRNPVSSANKPRSSTEQVVRFTAQPGSLNFKAYQVAQAYSLPELRALLREAMAELYAAEQLESIEIPWWREWTTILNKAIEQRLLAVLNKPLRKAPNGLAFPDIDTIKERSDIVALVSPHTELRPMGRIFKGLCPFHNEHTPSFHVWPEENRWHCFGCNQHGSVLDFVMMAHHLNLTDGLRYLANQAGIPWPELRPQKTRWTAEL